MQQTAKKQISVVLLQTSAVGAVLALLLIFRFLAPPVYQKASEIYSYSFEQNDLSPQLVRFAGAALDALSIPVSAETSAPFGASLKKYLPEDKYTSPVYGYTMSSGYGWRKHPVTGKKLFHKGVDLACAEGTPVYAAMDGIVEYTLYSASGGNSVRLRHGSGVETGYCHMQYTFVRTGEFVYAGEQIGTVGSTGNATGPHLHFAVLYNDCYYDPTGMLETAG